MVRVPGINCRSLDCVRVGLPCLTPVGMTQEFGVQTERLNRLLEKSLERPQGLKPSPILNGETLA